MQLRYTFMAHYANGTQDGQINAMGIFDRLYATAFPAMHREMYLVTSLETEPEDEGTARQIGVRLIDADGKTLTELQANITFGIGRQVINQLHHFQDLKFFNPGSYQFVILFDGKQVKAVDLELVKIDPPKTP